MKKATSSGQVDITLGGLVHKNRHAGFQFSWFDRRRESPAEAGFQPLFQTLYFLGIAVASQNDLLLSFKQSIECMEKFFL